MKRFSAIILLFTAINLSAQNDSVPTFGVVTAPGDPGHVVVGPSGTSYRAATGYFTVSSNYIENDTVYLIDDNAKAPTIYQLSRMKVPAPAPDPKYLFYFKQRDNAQLFSEITGLALIIGGGMLGGKAEYYSRYHGTSSNFDSFHITRDFGLLTTGAGCTFLGASFVLDSDLKPAEVVWKSVLAALLYRGSAEMIYGFMD